MYIQINIFKFHLNFQIWLNNKKSNLLFYLITSIQKHRMLKNEKKTQFVNIFKTGS